MTLPHSWNTKQDGSGVPGFRRKMRAQLGPNAAALMFDTPLPEGGSFPFWYLVRFLDRVPVDHAGNPGKRKFEVLAQGETLNELEWSLDRMARGHRVTAYSPVMRKGVGLVGLTAAETGALLLPPSVARATKD